MANLIENKHFFVIHAPRQSGKTTLLQSLARQLNGGGKHHALYCSLESVQGIEEVGKGIASVLECLRFAIKYHPGLRGAVPDCLQEQAENTALRAYLTDLAAGASRPVVIFFDEADCLSGPTLISFLRQLRDGYVNRSYIPFVHSLALAGMRNLRDYKAQVREDSKTLGSASPFNIVVESLTLKYFTRDEIAALYQQHTRETGQAFPPELVDQVFELTQGQPWLVNAIAREMGHKIANDDFTKPLTTAMAEEAAQRIILRRDTHVDSLLERLKETRVQRIIEPLLLGDEGRIRRESDDYQYVRDLGLIREDRGVIKPANPIYAEVIVRSLNRDAQEDLPVELIERWMDGQRIDMNGLLKGFQAFWRDNSEIWPERLQYREAAPHLILLAFLQRVINGGAKIDREFATGTRRVDICVTYAGQRYPIELKLVRNDRAREEGLTQLGQYLATLGCDEGWLVLFDLNTATPWDQRLYWETIQRDGRTLHLVGV